MPKLSIIVTAYNVAAYLGPCLDGIIGQTLEDIEVIVVDDGSTDGTGELVEAYAKADARVRAIRFEENTPGGVGPAANAGLAAATGDFIGFADGDDLYDPRMFGRLYDAAVAHDADLAMCRYHLMDDATGELGEPDEGRYWQPYGETTAVAMDAEQRSALLRFIAVPWRKIYRRDLVERVGLRFPEGDFFFEDNPVHWAAVLGARKVVMVPEYLCRHRVARPGQTMETADHRLPQIFAHHDTIRDLLRQMGMEAEHRDDLLLWLATQLAWVSARAEGDVVRGLYDRLVPVVGQYDSDEIARFCASAAPFGTAPLLKALKAEDFSAFEAAVEGRGRATTAGARPGRARGTSVWALGMYHLRHSGVRRTARLTGRFAAERLGLTGRKRTGGEGHAVTQKDVMMGLVVLQREMRELREEVAALRRELAEGRAAGTGAPEAGGEPRKAEDGDD
ncbi:glycosyltransferase family 2 protein [Roseovarius indicus]|uniref:Putative glycosyltransferase EpsJ n=1 Tax=Roseovarius indicus TaxID=540747 RepID=A0A5P3AIT5_9RHOB|nr:glycosyltransferase [Roseovarius indicus]QEW28258.1 putative glycosyltransferase EpsJ [Roseovarius indicus]SFE14147.1 Glycosyltransferase involved in cell wall bisynthesis [Roseovarius indicus]